MSDASSRPSRPEAGARRDRPVVGGDHEPRAEHPGGGPPGWLATAVGGAVGGLVGGFLAMLAAIAYLDTQPNVGLEGLVTLAIWTCIGAVVGGGVGAAALLRLRGHARPVASGILFAVFYALCAFGFFAAVATLTPNWDGDVWMWVVGLISLLASALASRAILVRRRTWGRSD